MQDQVETLLEVVVWMEIILEMVDPVQIEDQMVAQIPLMKYQMEILLEMEDQIILEMVVQMEMVDPVQTIEDQLVILLEVQMEITLEMVDPIPLIEIMEIIWKWSNKYIQW